MKTPLWQRVLLTVLLFPVVLVLSVLVAVAFAIVMPYVVLTTDVAFTEWAP